MSLQLRAAPSTARPVGVYKPRQKNPLLQRSHSSPFDAHPRRKPGTTAMNPKPSLKSSKTTSTSLRDDDISPLTDCGIINTLPTTEKLKDVVHLLRYIHENAFDPIPDRASGMNSVRISEILRFRQRLPPIVSVAHVHALSRSATIADRETAQAVQKGLIRRLRVPDRGLGSTAIGDSLVLTEHWVALVAACGGLEEVTKQKYMQLLKEEPEKASIGIETFTPQEATKLIKEGLLTTSSTAGVISPTTRPDASMLGSLTSLAAAGSRAAAGSVAAVGGEGAIHSAGGGGGGGAWLSSKDTGSTFTLTLPNVGLYLRLLESARTQLVALLAKSKYREAPLDLLRERWDGAVASTSTVNPRRGKGFADAILPGQTRRWKQFHGLRFQWVLEECLGAGLMECFDTGSVGVGVRLT